MVAINDGAYVSFRQERFGYTTDSRVEGFYPLEFADVAMVFASAFSDADLLDRAGSRAYGDPDLSPAVELTDHTRALLGVSLDTDIESYLYLALVVLVDGGGGRYRHDSGCCGWEYDGGWFCVIAACNGRCYYGDSGRKCYASQVLGA